MSSDSPKTPEADDADKVNDAIRRIKQGDLNGAEALLRQVIARTPAAYETRTETPDAIAIRFWTMDDFVYYVTKNQDKLTKNVTWLLNAYPRAYYYLGFIQVARGEPAAALDFLDAGMRLEPEQPMFRVEKAKALGMLK